MIELKFDLREFERKARDLDAALDQVPFALSLALNSAVKSAKQVIVEETWPTHITQRNSTFLKWILQPLYATKHYLRAEIFDRSNDKRGHLQLHAFGGLKVARGRLAIPAKGSVSRTARGVRKNQKPAAIIANTPKRALRITPHGIFVGKGGVLELKYIFRQSATQPADVPFEEAFQREVRRSFAGAFVEGMARAMRTRRPR